MTKPIKLPKVRSKDLTSECADGIWTPEGIFIEKTLKGRNRLETLIHELLHDMHTDWSERKVDQQAKKITAFLWRHKVRVLC